MNLQQFLEASAELDKIKVNVIGPTYVMTFANDTGSEFQLDINTLLLFIRELDSQYAAFHAEWDKAESKKTAITEYEEKSYRKIYVHAGNKSEFATLKSIGQSQTKTLTKTISALIAYLGKAEFKGVGVNTLFDKDSLARAVANMPQTAKELEHIVAAAKEVVADPTADEAALREAFRSWMRADKYSESTIASYSVTAIDTANRIRRQSDPSFRGVYSLHEAGAVQSLLDELAQSNDWNTLNSNGNGMAVSGVKKYKAFLESHIRTILLPKPFLLLAGISGTGKTRFVAEQAARTSNGVDNYLMVPVRPDWHEPSDLLGYISRIGGVKFVATPLLLFMAEAWRRSNAIPESGSYRISTFESVPTFWACLDEMNLAPVEQYFADFLAIIETREWEGVRYSCRAILNLPRLALDAAVLGQLRHDLGFDEADPLWTSFVTYGMPLPPNLVVAGTVNMDETTHGFSRKVIDRAHTIDFGEFYPNDFDRYFRPDTFSNTFAFSRYSRATQEDLKVAAADPDGSRSVAFLKEINAELKDSAFQLAFRALNELLLTVRAFAPSTDEQLAAVWDDFLVTKLLPRIEGDAERLELAGSGNSILTRLSAKAESQMIGLLTREETPKLRPDLYRHSTADLRIGLRTPRALQRMQERLERHNFTSFWP